MSESTHAGYDHTLSFPNLVRMFGWCVLALMAAFLINNFMTFWAGLPGANAAFGGGGFLALVQAVLYPVGMILAIGYVARQRSTTLRNDASVVSGINTYFIRAAFWAVLIVGVADVAISFLRVEDLLPAVVGEELTKDFGRSQFRGLYVHVPLMMVSLILAAFTRTLGFHWLALLIVIAELAIVFMRFIFSLRASLHGRSGAVLVRCRCSCLPVPTRCWKRGMCGSTCSMPASRTKPRRW